MSETTLRLPHPARLRLSPAGPARDAAYLVAGLPIGVVAFTVAVTGLALAAGLAITLLGIPVLMATLWLGRWLGWVERVRAAWLLRLPAPAAPRRRRDGDLLRRVKAAVADGAGWRGTLWGALMLPLGILGFTVAVTVWATALGLIASPLWYWSLDGADGPEAFASASVGWTALRVAVGVLLVPVAAWLCRRLADATARTAVAVTARR